MTNITSRKECIRMDLDIMVIVLLVYECLL